MFKTAFETLFDFCQVVLPKHCGSIAAKNIHYFIMSIRCRFSRLYA